jgi:hypothetical protein
MPIDKDFKRIVRQRMAATGERFTVAQAALTTEPTDSDTRSVRSPGGDAQELATRWIDLLSDPRQNQGAFGLLRALPPEQLGPLAVRGTRHADPKVRRRSCQLLDDLALTPEAVAALEACTEDEHPRVRGAALHTLGCEHCKPDGVCLDQRLIAERASRDRSAKVRRGVAMTLSWNPRQSDAWALDMATRLLDDASAEIRRYAQAALERIARQRRADEARRQLPEPLRTKTERHPGKWVAVLAGAIVAVDPGPSWRRRHPEAQLFFVTPDDAVES